MLTIRLTHNVDEAIRYLQDRFRNQVPFAVARALTATAKQAQQGIRAEMASTFDRPKPFTLGGSFFTPAKKADLTAVVGLKDQTGDARPPAKYLAAQIGGGPRRQAGYELALQKLGALPAGWRVIPGAGAKLDRYGNLNQQQFTEMIGALRSRMRVIKGRGKRAAAAGYFAALPGSPATQHLQPGIYYRVERTGSSAIIPVLIFAPAAAYQKRLDLEKVVQKTVADHFVRELDASLQQAIATAR